MDNHTQERFNDLIKHFGGLTPDMKVEDVYNAFGKIVSQNNPKHGQTGRTIIQQRNELFSISKDWKRDLSDFIQRNEKAIEALTPESTGIFRLQYEASQFFSNTNYRLHDFRLKDFSAVFFDALHYDRTPDSTLIDFLRTTGAKEKPTDSNRNSVTTKLLTEDYFELFIITIFQMGDLYHSLPILKDELQKLEHGKATGAAYTGLNEIPDKELQKIFNVSKLADFRKLEQRLFDRNYLDDNRQWLGRKPELIALILCLQDNRYFKNSVTDKQIKDFFQELYQIDITQQWEPARRIDAEKYKSIFTSIINNP